MSQATTLVSVATILIASSAFAQDIAVNGGFETGDTTGWSHFPGESSHTFNITADAASGLWAAELFNGPTGTPSANIAKNANLGMGTVNPGDVLTISFSAKGSFAAGGVAFAEFFTEIDGGGTSSSQILGGAPLNVLQPLTDWTDFSFDVVVGPNASGGVTVQFNAATGGDQGSTSVFFIDNLRVVPTPSAAAVLGFGGHMASRRRRA
jgi:hypothetical protein